MRRRPHAIEVLLCCLGGLAAAASTQTEWAAAGSCVNTGVVRGITSSDGSMAWAAVFSIAVAAAVGAPWLAGRAGAGFGFVAIGVAAVACWALAALVLAPYEAFPPQGTAGPVSILCDLQPQTGFWLAISSVVLLAATWVMRWVPGARHGLK